MYSIQRFQINNNLVGHFKYGCWSFYRLFYHAVIIFLAGVNFLPNHVVDAFSFRAPLVNPAVYMEWLYEQCRVRGARMVRDTLKGPLGPQIGSLMKIYRVDDVVNCSGLDAKELAGDEAVYPMRGALVSTKNDGTAFPKVDYRMAYIFEKVYGAGQGEHEATGRASLHPMGSNMLLLGVFYQPNEYDTNMSVSHPLVRRLLQECITMSPCLSVLEDKDLRVNVGVRPMRVGGVRLERDSEYPRLIHNYGHGRIGYILSWGCAQECVKMLNHTLTSHRVSAKL